MADVTAMLAAYHEADVAGIPTKDYVHLLHIAPDLFRDVARAMKLSFTQIVERGKGIGGSDRYRMTLTCSWAQRVWFREIHFQRASIN